MWEMLSMLGRDKDKVGWTMPTLFREIVLPFQPAKHRP